MKAKTIVRRFSLLLGIAILSPLALLAEPQLDHPGASKSGPGCTGTSSITSPDRQYSAYISCLGAEQGAREITLTVLDAAGRQTSTLAARVKQGCTPGAPSWLDDSRVGILSRTDPEVSAYLVFNIQAGPKRPTPATGSIGLRPQDPGRRETGRYVWNAGRPELLSVAERAGDLSNTLRSC